MAERILPTIVEDWKPRQQNTLRGFVRVRLPSGMVLHDVAVHEKNGKYWASPAGKPQLDRNDTAIRENGKIKYAAIVSFETKAVGDRFSQQVVEALRRGFPEALA